MVHYRMHIHWTEEGYMREVFSDTKINAYILIERALGRVT